jgi:transposase
MTTVAGEHGAVTVGVDTHSEAHVAAVLSGIGRLLGSRQFPATPSGHAELLRWAGRYGKIAGCGVEGTGSYGAQLARDLRRAGQHVIEVDRPDRRARRFNGKDDHLDAEAAARAVLAGTARTVPKDRCGQVEAIRALRIARRTAVSGRTAAINQLKALLVTAPSELREQLRALSTTAMITTAARFRPAEDLSQPLNATKYALREIAVRHQFLTAQLNDLDRALDTLVATAAPALVAASPSAPTPQARCWSPPATTPNGSPTRARSRTCAASRPCPPPAATPPGGTVSTAAATAAPTTPSGASCSSGWAPTSAPRTTSPDAPRKACPNPRSCAASNATSPGRSSPPSTTRPRSQAVDNQ